MLQQSQIDQMNPGERLRAIEQLWDSLAATPESVESPGWHGDALAERKRRAAAGESRFSTLEELRASLREDRP